MECLRMIAMLMVMVLHANFGAMGYPSPKNVAAEPWTWFGLMTMEFCAIGSVDIFVLITGWFGTHFKPMGMLRLVYQVIFICTLALLTLWAVGGGSLPTAWSEIGNSYLSYWFINSYLLLYLLSPVLNAYIKQNEEKDFRRLLILLLVVDALCGVAFEDFSRGYSVMHFIVLYLLGRYLRLHLAEKLWWLPRWSYLALFGLLVGAMSLTYWAVYAFRIPLGFNITKYFLAYTNPLIVCSAVCLLLYFSRLHFQSKAINWLAAGSLTAYLCHQQIFVRPFYTDLFRWVDEVSSPPTFLPLFLLTIAAAYTASVVIDQARQWSWKRIEKRISKRKEGS